MSSRQKANLQVVGPEMEALETLVAETAKQTAPMVQRFSSHRDRIDLALKELESERFELISRRDLLHRQTEAIEAGIAMHIADIEATMKLYESGINAQDPVD